MTHRPALFLTLSAALILASAAKADPYRWCAVYGGMFGGPTNCGFQTLAQCRATVSGIGGYCEPNRFYTGPETSGRGSREKRRKAVEQ